MGIEQEHKHLVPEVMKIEQVLNKEMGFTKRSMAALKNVKVLMVEQERAEARHDVPRVRATQERINENLRVASVAMDNIAFLTTEEKQQHPTFSDVFAKEFQIARDITVKIAMMRHSWQSGKELGINKMHRANAETLKLIDAILKEETALLKLEAEMVKKFKHLA
jgi:hypothetical protein